MIYEIRNYHFRPDLIDAYKAWAKAEAIPHLVSQLDVVGFWINSKDTPGQRRAAGSSRHGQCHLDHSLAGSRPTQRSAAPPRVEPRVAGHLCARPWRAGQLFAE
jgi:hypothetical protein